MAQPNASIFQLQQQHAGNFSMDVHDIEWRHPLLAVILACVCILTTAGNCLVVIAVCTKKYLRNPTGYLIISLAIADLIVGVVVMPLNSLFEMTQHVWLLGLTMCDLFHALDILASTSSIWNLCIISLDRYLAGQDPIGYRDKVSKRRITFAIGFVWMMSAVLSFPAILWWRRSSPHLYEKQTECKFTDDSVYVSFSSLVSFYIPLCLILFAYGKVFLIATRHSRSLKSGIKKVKCKGGQPTKKKESESAVSEEPAPTLRIHFGKGPNKVTSKSMRHPRQGAATTRLLLKQVSCRSLADRPPSSSPSVTSPLLCPPTNSQSMNTFGLLRPRPYGSSSVSRAQSSHSVALHDMEEERRIRKPSGVMAAALATASMGTAVATTGSTNAVKKKIGVREKSRQMMKYVHEQRAARTLSIVVGAFILCWSPFFFFSPLNVFCQGCFANADQLFTIFTWAGHLNSMLNPLIYSRFSRDFRRAFKQILTCQRERKVKTAIKTPLSLVFTQLVSITQFWEPPERQTEVE